MKPSKTRQGKDKQPPMGRRRIPEYPADTPDWHDEEWFGDDPYHFKPRLRHERHYTTKGARSRRPRGGRHQRTRSGWAAYPQGDR